MGPGSLPGCLRERNPWHSFPVGSDCVVVLVYVPVMSREAVYELISMIKALTLSRSVYFTNTSHWKVL